MRSPRPSHLLLLAFLLLISCASAEKRLDQGRELETRGQYEAATTRYAQALQKDPDLPEARERLRSAGEQAILQRVEDANAWATRNEPVEAAVQFQRADAVQAQAQNVGVRLPLPANYHERRRASFDQAIAALMDQGDRSHEQGRWADGIVAYRRARESFEPSADQRTSSLTAEANLRADWCETEYASGHLRAAYEVATGVQQLEWSPADAANRAFGVAEQALAEGEVELLVLPLTALREGRRSANEETDLTAEVQAALEAGPWRQPPAFVRLDDPLIVRDLISHSRILDGNYAAAAMAALLRLAKADYGARLQLVSSQETEFDVRSTPRTVRTVDGQSVTFLQEEGKRRLHAEVQVIVCDDYGNALSQVVVTGIGEAPFSRGVYDGDARELKLDRRQVDLFDRYVQEAQLVAARRALALDLAHKLADTVYGPVLAQIP